MLWRFLLGDVPPRLLNKARAELEQHDDLQLLQVADEPLEGSKAVDSGLRMDYRHVGDAYSAWAAKSTQERLRGLPTPNPELVKLIVGRLSRRPSEYLKRGRNEASASFGASSPSTTSWRVSLISQS